MSSEEERKGGNPTRCAAQMEKKEDHHVVDITSLAQELMVELADVKSLTERAGGGDLAPPSIIVDRVNDLTRNVDQQEYEPQYVSIGPWHRKPQLVRDTDKVRALNDVLSAAAAAAAANGAPLCKLDDYLGELALLEPRARSFYAHSFSIPSRDFVRMLLLDGCYILVRFGDFVRRGAAANGLLHGGGGHRVVPSEETRGAAAVKQQEAVAVVRDVFYLAENQIPFFVVKKIHELTFLDGNIPAVHAIARYAHELLRMSYSVAMPTVVAPPALQPQPANLLHLLHMHFTPSALQYDMYSRGTAGAAKGKPVTVGRWRKATEYAAAGVTFKWRALDTRGGGARCILDVKVNSGGGTLQVPRLNIDAETWRLLRNLMALEQHNPEAAGSHVTAYCVFMSQLACTAEDVVVLCRRGIIVHGLGNDDEVAKHFADLCKGAVFDVNDAGGNYLRPVCQALERRYQSRPGRWMAWLKRKYFINPWLAAGLVAAAVGLVCTVIQAVYSVLSYTQAGGGN